MLDKERTRGDSNVVAALNNVYKPALTAFEQFHRQEHRLNKRYRYKKFAKRYDKLVDHAHHVRHKVLNRVEHLGGDVDSVLDPIRVADDMQTVHENTLACLKEIQGRLGQATAVATSANDHTTHAMLLGLQKKNEKAIKKVEALERQREDLGNDFMLTGV